MSNIYEQFNEEFNVKDFAKEVAELEKNKSGVFEKVPYGKYEVSVEEMKLTKSKTKGEPMVSICFKVIDGEFENRKIYMNKVVVYPKWLHDMNEFLRSMVVKCKNAPAIKFDTWDQYGYMLLDVHEAIDGSFEFGLNYYADSKMYDAFEITDVFTLD